ncbi:cytochrome p450 89a2-like protein [Trifolium pratense]|uniref:Cytochrome p450 89a2-like protein n=2 Tax=Trifolium pratense TaxID=57577 RepID=A0A2K3LU57_TRIPR|nr:cytochrome p450 89a2-like protein [Trifolium pratense]
METWFIAVLSLCIIFLIRATFSSLTNNKPTVNLPPGPPHIPIITTLLWLRKSFSQLEPVLKTLHAKHGPIITLKIISRPSIFIADHSIAHHALIQNSSIFSDRPKPFPTSIIMSCNQHTISSAFYGATWRTLRRNLASEMLHPSKIKSFSEIRKWVLDTLIIRLKSASESEYADSVTVIPHFKYAMFCLLVFMCFGERINHEKINDIDRVQRSFLLSISKINILNFWPKVTRILLHKRWEEFLKLRKDQEDVLLPLIRARKQAKESRLNNLNTYVDTLLELELPEEKRKLNEEEMVSLCLEFLGAGTDTTSTALQWIMANLVKYPDVQRRIVEEIRDVMGGDDKGEKKEVKEEDLHKFQYLKCVILEGLRRHPPGHFVLPHAVTEDVVLNGYLVPKTGVVNFLVAQMGWDSRVWEDPMEFKPERFLKDETFDITGKKEIKMMPFGAGRRICPGYTLALLHLEYFVANLVWNFDWKVPEGGDVDLSETSEFTVVMTNPLKVHISLRM